MVFWCPCELCSMSVTRLLQDVIFTRLTGTHLKMCECLQCKLRGQFWVKVALNLGKHWNVAKGGLLSDVFIKIPHAKLIRVQFFY